MTSALPTHSAPPMAGPRADLSVKRTFKRCPFAIWGTRQQSASVGVSP